MGKLQVLARRIAHALVQLIRALAAPGAGPKFFSAWA